MKIDWLELARLIKDPAGEGIPYLLRQELGTDKGNALAPFIVQIIAFAKDKTLDEIVQMVAVFASEEASAADVVPGG